MTEPDPAFEGLLEHLKASRGFDFTGYKRSSLMRRVDRRMSHIGITDYGSYVEHLEVNADEFTLLFNTILINVTGFFRDAEAWQALRDELLPAVLESHPGTPLRVWSAGCASGEEAYTLAMVLAEMLGAETFRERVKIYATDVDDEALAHARQGSYTARQCQGVPPELLERYFEASAGRHSFRKDLRRSVIFGRNDLVQDAPISRIDLLVCRNTLMYFTAEMQARILSRFHFALAEDGVLFLGKAERLLSQGALFVPVDLKRRTFRKAPREVAPGLGHLLEPWSPARRTETPMVELLRSEALLSGPFPQVVITADGVVAAANRQAEMLFQVSPRDVGRPFRDLDVSYRPLELRWAIEQAAAEQRLVRVSGVANPRGAESTHYEAQVCPLIGPEARYLGVAVTFVDVTATQHLQDEVEHANRRLDTAYEELQSTNEELETTNEELQSTVEELETTNEELQSTNEELETMNEELQSTNDELQTINDELQDRTADLDRANSFLETILTGLHAGVVVVDAELHVRVWNRQAEELWGLRRDEAVTQHFLNLDFGLPTEQLRPVIRRVLADGDPASEMAIAAVNRRGRTITVRVLASPWQGPAGAAGVIMTMEEIEPASGPLVAAP